MLLPASIDREVEAAVRAEAEREAATVRGIIARIREIKLSKNSNTEHSFSELRSHLRRARQASETKLECLARKEERLSHEVSLFAAEVRALLPPPGGQEEEDPPQSGSSPGKKPPPVPHNPPVGPPRWRSSRDVPRPAGWSARDRAVFAREVRRSEEKREAAAAREQEDDGDIFSHFDYHRVFLETSSEVTSEAEVRRFGARWASEQRRRRETKAKIRQWRAAKIKDKKEEKEDEGRSHLSDPPPKGKREEEEEEEGGLLLRRSAKVKIKAWREMKGLERELRGAGELLEEVERKMKEKERRRRGRKAAEGIDSAKKREKKEEEEGGGERRLEVTGVQKEVRQAFQIEALDFGVRRREKVAEKNSQQGKNASNARRDDSKRNQQLRDPDRLLRPTKASKSKRGDGAGEEKPEPGGPMLIEHRVRHRAVPEWRQALTMQPV